MTDPSKDRVKINISMIWSKKVQRINTQTGFPTKLTKRTTYIDLIPK